MTTRSNPTFLVEWARIVLHKNNAVTTVYEEDTLTEFIRLPNLVVNLSQVQEIHFPGNTVLLHYQDSRRSVLTGRDAAVFLDVLKRRYDLITDPATWPCLEQAIAKSEW